MAKGHNSGKKQSGVTSIQYDPLQVMGTITGKFHQNPLKTVGGVAETRLCLRTDEPISPLRLTSKTSCTKRVAGTRTSAD